MGDQGFSLGQIWITNGHEEDRELLLKIERKEEVLLDEVFELGVEPGANKVEVEPTWTADPAVYTLTYGRPDMEKSTVKLTAEDDTSADNDCMFLNISFHPATRVPGHSMTPTSEHPWVDKCP